MAATEQPPVQEMSREKGKTVVFLDGSCHASPVACPSSSPSRLILEIHGYSCCGPVPVLAEELLERAPPELAALGIDDATWARWMARLKADVQSYMLSVMGTCCGALFCCCPCLCLYNSLLQSRAQAFSEDINRELFEPRGMFWSLQRADVMQPDCNNCGVTVLTWHWAAIALNPEEAERLKEEPHVFHGCFGDPKVIPNRACDSCVSCLCQCCAEDYM